jgi:hypothetical protein
LGCATRHPLWLPDFWIFGPNDPHEYRAKNLAAAIHRRIGAQIAFLVLEADRLAEPTHGKPLRRQEVVSQAAKNLGYLTASAAELNTRRAKWEGGWRGTPIPRLQRGAAVADFAAAFVRAVAAPQAIRRVTLVTSSLSKAAVARAFDDIDINAPTAEVVHVLWLLSAFVDQCRSIGAVPEIVCRP